MPTNPPAANSATPQQSLVNAIVDGIRGAKLELPVMPRVASRIFALSHDVNADTADLSQLIHSDPSIASHVLRIANSASFGGGESIVSLQQAVTRLGMKLLGEIAICVSIQGNLYRAKGFEREIARLLKRALAAAAYGKEIARKRRRNVEGQFLCGLLHAVGKPICYQLVSVAQEQLGLRLSPEQAEQVVNALEGKVAAKVAADWKLPRQIQITTVYHSRYAEAPAFADECAATYLSAILAHWLVEPDKIDSAALAADPVFERLNFYPDDAQDLLDRADEVRALVSAMSI